MMSSLPLGWSLGLHLYGIFMTVALLGIIFFAAWVLRQSQEHLKQWMIWLLIVGVVGCFLTFQYGWSAWQQTMGGMMGNGQMMNGNMMNGMMGQGGMMNNQ